jgi:DNA polymerase II large subunit
MFMGMDEREEASLRALLKSFRKNLERPKTRLKTLYELHEEMTQKIAEIEVLKAEWEEKEVAFEWAENLNTAMQPKNVQINQIKIEKLVEIIEQNKEFLTGGVSHGIYG